MDETQNQPSQKSLPKSMAAEERSKTVKSLITASFRLAGRNLLTGVELDLEAKVWEYVLDAIPTHHLEECFRRAARAKTDTFPILATDINAQYKDMLPELQRQADDNEDRLLLAGGSNEYMTLLEWKEKHNLPPEWRMNIGMMYVDPYPPESDLYGQGVPPMPEGVWRCEECRDAHWVKDYPHSIIRPELVPCPVCAGARAG